jgi:hypothetical protein
MPSNNEQKPVSTGRIPLWGQWALFVITLLVYLLPGNPLFGWIMFGYLVWLICLSITTYRWFLNRQMAERQAFYQAERKQREAVLHEEEMTSPLTGEQEDTLK